MRIQITVRAGTWIGRAGTLTLVAMVVAMAVAGAASASANGFALADWTAVGGNVATGTLAGQTISLAGSQVSQPPGSTVDGTSFLFSDPYFTPSLPTSDAIEFQAGSPAKTYTLQFGVPTQDPVLDLGSLGSTLQFPPGTSITRVSGSNGFAVSGSAVSGTPDNAVDPTGENDSNGTVQLTGTFQSISFSADYPPGVDGIYLQVGVTVPGPQSEIVLNPAAPGPSGAYTAPVGVRVSAIDGAGVGSVETRCVLDPPAPPASFDDIPVGCPYLVRASGGGGSVATPGAHTVYAASRDLLGTKDTPVSKTFRIVIAPDTTITDGPSGAIWDPAPQFAFTSTVSGSTFQCRLDGGVFSACVTLSRTPVLAAGDHTFEVRAISPDGAVDPSPALRAFTLNAPSGTEHTCRVQPVYWFSATLERGHADKYACQIGTPTAKDGCAPEYNCVWTNDVCPQGARCTLTTQLAWYDADTHFDWAASAAAGTGPAVGAGTLGRRTYDECTTGWDGDRCFARTSLAVLGDGSPLYASCSASLDSRGMIGVSTFSYDYIRRIECTADWQITPAVPLLALALGHSIQVNAPGTGVLKAAANLVGLARLASVAASRPAIAPVRVNVKHAGPVTIPLKLNPAAKRLLQRNKKLKIRLRATFTQQGAQPLTKTTLLTLTPPAFRPRTCRVPGTAKRPKRQLRCVTHR